MNPILSILLQAFVVGLILVCVYMMGAFVIKSREQTIADFFSKKFAAGVWLFISGFVGDLVAYLGLV